MFAAGFLSATSGNAVNSLSVGNKMCETTILPPHESISSCPQVSWNCENSANVGENREQNHVNAVRPWKCEKCTVAFKLEAKLIDHVRIHSGEKPFRCEQCNETFRTGEKQKEHNRIHTGEKPFKCEVCGFAFRTKSNLKQHSTSHSNERLHKCEECGLMFKTKWKMRTHQRIHTGEKPYKCDLCDASFRNTTKLKKHKKYHVGKRDGAAGNVYNGESQENSNEKIITQK